MRRLTRSVGIALAGLIVLFLLVRLGAHLFTDRSLLARAVAWQESDFGDWRRFPARVVENAGPPFHFRPPTDAERTRYAAALSAVSWKGKTRPLEAFLRGSDTVAFLVVRDDALLYERYFHGYGRESTVTSFSTAKSFVSALVGIAIAEGAIGGVEDPLTRYVPELLEKDPRYAAIRLRHLLTMSSGIRYEEHGLPWSDDAATYYSPDLRRVAVSAGIAGEPGRTFHYNNFHPLLLGLVLERTTGRPVAEYLQEKIWKPLGMEAAGSWSLDREGGFEKMESGLNGRAIDFAKFGRLFLRGGNWNGVQLIPAEWVEESTRLDTATDPAAGYQYFWWVDGVAAGGSAPGAPAPGSGTPGSGAPGGGGASGSGAAGGRAFLAAGKHGQYIYIVPGQDLLMVRFGRTDPLHGGWREVFRELAARLGEADAGR